jgi:hypothetical protein
VSSFGGIEISRGIAGVGVSGISTTSLRFRTTYDMEYAGQAAAVGLSGLGDLPTFYIDRRRSSDGIWTVECLDRTAFLDVPIDTDGWAKSGGRYSTSAVAAGLRALGFSSVALPYTAAYIPCTAVDGMTYQGLLQEMSEVYTGFFAIGSGDALTFTPYGSVTSQDVAVEWSRIERSGTFTYGRVELSNGTQTASVGSGAFPLEISGELVDVQSAGSYQSLTQTVFTGWSVDNCIGTYGQMPYIGGTMTFGSETLRITRADGRVVGDRLIISAGGDIPQYGEINRKGLLQRRLDEMVSTTKRYGTGMMTTYQGYTLTDGGA